ncbi:hypothetical protein [Streptomyces sp. NPDC060194]|uniref:hypothetical protein n=1 Tax=Streptomyces sp. NPDC060194 TaxID=3347069 RepID=UPI00365130BD
MQETALTGELHPTGLGTGHQLGDQAVVHSTRPTHSGLPGLYVTRHVSHQLSLSYEELHHSRTDPTGVRLVLVCHHRAVRVFLEREFQQVEHTVAEASALGPEASVLLPEAGPAAPARRVSEALCPLANRWIGLPVLTTFLADDDPAGPCQCAVPMAAERGFFRPVIASLAEAGVAWRLHRATAHP